MRKFKHSSIQALKFRMQALFLMQIQNLKSNFRGFDFLLFKVWIQSLEGYGYPGAGFWIRFA